MKWVNNRAISIKLTTIYVSFPFHNSCGGEVKLTLTAVSLMTKTRTFVGGADGTIKWNISRNTMNNTDGNYMFKVDNRYARTRCEIYSKLQRHQNDANEHISHLV